MTLLNGHPATVMNDALPAPTILHDAAAHRFHFELDGHQAELTYRREGRLMVIDHTWVPQAIGGRGLAGRLVQAAFEHARENHYKVVPACSYAAVWVSRHPEFADTLAG